MRTRAKPKPESPQLARQISLGFILRALRGEHSCETKPIPGATGRDGAWGTRAVACCTNKPNFRRTGFAESSREPIVRNEPNFRRNFKFEVSSVKRIVQNEPNFASRDGVGGARGGPVGRGTPSFHHPTIPGFHCRPGPGGPIVQNEPNSRRYRVGRGPRGVGPGADVRNKANWRRGESPAGWLWTHFSPAQMRAKPLVPRGLGSWRCLLAVIWRSIMSPVRGC
jgi:hypothetical protein